jgi:hypothetical protein
MNRNVLYVVLVYLADQVSVSRCARMHILIHLLYRFSESLKARYILQEKDSHGTRGRPHKIDPSLLVI